jgi:hypothetical protein
LEGQQRELNHGGTETRLSSKRASVSPCLRGQFLDHPLSASAPADAQA